MELLTTILCLAAIMVFTVGGSFSVLIFKKFNPKLSNILLSLSSGMMIGIAGFCLLREAVIDINEKMLLPSIWAYGSPILFCLVGFLVMVLFDMFLLKFSSNSKSGKVGKMMTAICLHNIPEGLSLGIVIGELFGNFNADMIRTAISFTLILSIHNLIQSFTTSLVFKEDGLSNKKSVLLMSITGLIEIVFAVAGILLSANVETIVPFIASFAAGIMIFVAILDLLKDALEYKKYGLTIIFFLVGLTLMGAFEILFEFIG